jgi:hypothetical protein
VPTGAPPRDAPYERTALATQDVEIVTTSAPGVRAVAATPPAYGVPEPWPAALQMRAAESAGFM